MIGLGLSISDAAAGFAGSIVLSHDTVVEDASPGAVIGALTVSGGGIGPWTFSLTDDAGGRFAISGGQLVVGTTALDHTNTPKPVITVQATDGSRTVRATVGIAVRVRSFGLPQTGDLVFGAQANTGYPVRAADTQFAVAAGREHTLCETWLPAQPAGARVIYATSWGHAAGNQPCERDLVNDQAIAWSSLMNTVNGNTRRADVTFTEFGATTTGGGFTISDPIGVAITDGNALRTVISAPLGGQRMATGAYNIIGEQQRASATLSALDGARVSGAASTAGSSIFNLEGFTASGIVAPMAAGYRSFLLIGTSIMRGQDATSRFIQSPSRNAFGFLPLGLDQAVNGRMGWWIAAVPGQSIAAQNDDAAGKFRRRFAILEAIAVKNGGRWPFTDVVIDLRNDFILLNGADAVDTFNLCVAKARTEIAAIAELFRGIPVHLVDMPPIQPVGGSFQASRYCTELATQVPGAGNFKTAAIKLFNAWVATNYASIGAAGVIKAGSACCAPDDGSGLARWRLTPFTAAGGGVLHGADYPSGLPAGVNVGTTGITVTSAVAPEIGAYLALFDSDLANPEGIAGNAGNAGAHITSVTAAGAGKWLVRTSSGSTARARAAGSVVRTAATQDGTHPSHWLQMGAMAEAVVAWKATA